MLVHLYADPSCPFTWVTSRWLTAAVGPGDALVVRPLSLALVNEGGDVPEPYAGYQAAALPVLRTFEAVRDAGGDDAVAELYAAVGRPFHVDGTASFDVPAALAEVGLDPGLAEAGEDATRDEGLRTAIAVANALVGEEVGSPVVALPDEGVAFWGPILREAPTGPAAAELLAAVATLARTPGFGQVKRALGGDLVLG